jgi:hypothetical protein
MTKPWLKNTNQRVRLTIDLSVDTEAWFEVFGSSPEPNVPAAVLRYFETEVLPSVDVVECGLVTVLSLPPETWPRRADTEGE